MEPEKAHSGATGRCRETAMTVAELLAPAVARLRRAGNGTAVRDARLLLAMVSELTPESMMAYPERIVDRRAGDAFAALVARRATGVPLSRLAGRREFWSLSFALGPDTLDPRPDSETLVSEALNWVDRRGAAGRSRPWRILDLGTGTGCLPCAVLSELPNSTALGVDISSGACAVARDNAIALGLGGRIRFVLDDWNDPEFLAAEAMPFDIVLANPPYIASGLLPELPADVREYDPLRALDGGGDGLCAYRAIAGHLSRLLAQDGIALLEIGADQGASVPQVLVEAGLRVVGCVPDIEGRDRCIMATV